MFSNNGETKGKAKGHRRMGAYNEQPPVGISTDFSLNLSLHGLVV